MSEEEKKAYFELIDCSKVEDIYNYLPNKKSTDFKKVMFYIINKLLDSYKEYMAFGEDEVDEILADIEAKIKICMEYYGYSYSRKLPFVNKVMFCMSDKHNYYFDNDIKNVIIDRHLKKVFEYILYGVDESDSTKVVHYNKSQHKLAGCYKYKDYQTRVYTRKVSDDVVCIFGIFCKKDNNDLHLDDTASKRLKSTVYREIEDLKKKFSDPLKREELLDLNNKYLMSFLEKIGFEFKTVEEEFNIQKIENFLLSELSLNYTLMPKKEEDNFDYYAYVAFEILNDKGYVDLEDERAKEINLGAWLDRQIEEISSYKLSDKKMKDILLLVSNKISRLTVNDKELNHYPLSNVSGLEIGDVDFSDGAYVHDIMNDYYFKNVARSKWLDFYATAKSIFRDKGFVDLEDERAKKIELGRWIDLQIELLSKGELDKTKQDFIMELVSNLETRKEEIIVPELEEQKKLVSLSKKVIRKIEDSVAIISYDELKKIDELLDEYNLEEDEIKNQKH